MARSARKPRTKVRLQRRPHAGPRGEQRPGRFDNPGPRSGDPITTGYRRSTRLRTAATWQAAQCRLPNMRRCCARSERQPGDALRAHAPGLRRSRDPPVGHQHPRPRASNGTTRSATGSRDDPTVGDGSFSSPGAFGLPVDRREQDLLRHLHAKICRGAIDSVRCGRLIRQGLAHRRRPVAPARPKPGVPGASACSGRTATRPGRPRGPPSVAPVERRVESHQVSEAWRPRRIGLLEWSTPASSGWLARPASGPRRHRAMAARRHSTNQATTSSSEFVPAEACGGSGTGAGGCCGRPSSRPCTMLLNAAVAPATSPWAARVQHRQMHCPGTARPPGHFQDRDIGLPRCG